VDVIFLRGSEKNLRSLPIFVRSPHVGAGEEFEDSWNFGWDLASSLVSEFVVMKETGHSNFCLTVVPCSGVKLFTCVQIKFVKIYKSVHAAFLKNIHLEDFSRFYKKGLNCHSECSLI